MAINRDVGQLDPVLLRPTKQTPTVQYSGAPDMSDTQRLIQGLSGLSDGVARLGGVYLGYKQQQKEDPEAKRLAYARSAIEVAQAGNDPDAARALYDKAGSDPNPAYKQGVSEAMAKTYLGQIKDTLLQEGSAQGWNNVDWNKRGAELIAAGAKYLPDDHAKAAFIGGYNQLIEQFRTQGVQQTAQNAEFSKLNNLQVATQNDFVKAAASGPEAAQKVLDKLYSSPEFNSVQPDTKQKLVEQTILGVVQSGDVAAFKAMENVSGPDGINLATKYAGNWQVWSKQVEEAALRLKDGERTDATIQAQGSYADQLAHMDNLSGGFVGQTVKAQSAARALAFETKRLVEDAVLKDGIGNVNIDQFRSEALQRLKDDGLAQDPRAVDAFTQAFDTSVEQFKNGQQDARNKDAKLQTDATTIRDLSSRFGTALAKGGTAAAVAEMQTALTENQVFQGRSLTEQVNFLQQIAAEQAAGGNIAAVRALGQVKVNGSGLLLKDALGIDFDKAEATAINASNNMRDARLKQAQGPLRAKAVNGIFTEDDAREALASGQDEGWVADMVERSNNARRQKEEDTWKLRANTAKQDQLRQSTSNAARILTNGRADLLLDSSITPDPRDPTKTVTITRDERIKAGLDEVRSGIEAELSSRNPTMPQAELDRQVQVEMMKVNSRNGLVDDNTQNLFKTFLGKMQFADNVSEDDVSQLKEMQNAKAIYSPAALDDLLGNEQKKAFFHTLMSKLDEGASPQQAIAYARGLRDAPADQRLVLTPQQRKEIEGGVQSVKSSLSGWYDGTTDPFIDGVIEKKITDKVRAGASVAYATSEAVRDVQSSYVNVNGRHVNFTQFAGAKNPEHVKEVLDWATEQYAKLENFGIHGPKVVIDNGDKPGTVRLYDASTGLQLNDKLINWSDIVKDWTEKVGAPREVEREAQRKAEAERIKKNAEFRAKQGTRTWAK